MHTVLLSTDLVARGLDFPVVDRVLQLDALEDAETYIHRAGRTRYESHGKVLLLLCPSEEEGEVSFRARGAQVPLVCPSSKTRYAQLHLCYCMHRGKGQSNEPTKEFEEALRERNLGFGVIDLWRGR